MIRLGAVHGTIRLRLPFLPPLTLTGMIFSPWSSVACDAEVVTPTAFLPLTVFRRSPSSLRPRSAAAAVLAMVRQSLSLAA